MGKFGFTFPKIKFEVKYNFDASKYIQAEVLGNSGARNLISVIGDGRAVRTILESLKLAGIPNIGYFGAQALIPTGLDVKIFSSAGDLAKESLIIITACKSSNACTELYASLTPLADPATFLDFSDASVETAAAIWEGARQHKHKYLDCGLVGLQFERDDDRMSVFVGGKTSHFESVKPILSSIAPRVRHMGKPGNGFAAAQLTASLEATIVAATAETLALASGLGLDTKKMTGALKHSLHVDVSRVADAVKLQKFEKSAQFTTVRGCATSSAAVSELAKQAQRPAKLVDATKDWFGEVEEDMTGEDCAAVYSAMAKGIPNIEPWQEPESENENDEGETEQPNAEKVEA